MNDISLKDFIDKYFWINNNYSVTSVISEEEVRNRLNSLLSKNPLTRNSKVKAKVKLGKEDKRLVELLKHYSKRDKDDRAIMTNAPISYL